MRRTSVLMVDPRHFAIRGGANPHTRNPDASLKTVDADRAREQWHAYVDALLEGGVEVYVAEAAPELTGMVFAANAGFIPDRLRDRPVAEKDFYPSHFTAEHRRPETPKFRQFMRAFGFDVRSYPEELAFEGEADAFPVRGAAPNWIFTWGFRSDPEVGDWLADEVLGEDPVRLELEDPAYYHGDCAICELGGPLLAWPGALTDDSVDRLEEAFGDRLVTMSDADGEAFVGNSFYVETDEGGRLLYTPAEISAELTSRIERFGVEVVPVDVSEFFGKGGGGPKCLVFNLGPVDRDAPEVLPACRDFRRRRHVDNLRDQGAFERDPDPGGE